MKFVLICFGLMYLCTLFVNGSDEATPSYARARIESCPGCSLNRLAEVKKFVYEDVPKYENVEFKKIQGAPPELVLLDENDTEIERLKLGQLSRKECNDLLTSKGFHLKDNAKLEL